jgi:hypothetical protein
VTLDPRPVVRLPTILLVEPTDEAARREAGRIYGEILLDGLEGQATHGDEFFEHVGELRVGKVAAYAVEVRRALDEPSIVGVS